MRLENKEHRFLLAGITTTLLYFLLNWLLMSVNVRPGLSAVISFTITFICAYSIQRTWTFASQTKHCELLPRYLASQLVCMTISAGAAEITHSLPQLSDDVIVAAAATLVSGSMSYFLSSRWVFVTRTPD